MKKLLEAVWLVVATFFRMIGRALAFVFGVPDWRPPPWLALLLRLLGQLRAGTADWANAHPRLSVSLLVGALILGAAGYGGWRWWESQPKPVRFTVTGTSPRATPLERDAQIEPLYVDFSGSAARLEQVGKRVSAGIKLAPPLKGHWTWESDKRLKFMPEEDWGVGVEHVVTFDKTLFPPHVLLERYDYRFRTETFTLSDAGIEFYTDPEDPKNKKVIATLRASHPIDKESLRKRVTIRRREIKDGVLDFVSDPVPFTITLDEYKGRAFIHSDVVPIPLESYEMVVTTSADVVSERGGAGTEDEVVQVVRIPGMYDYFRIASVDVTFARNERYEPEQVIVIETTARARQEDILKHLSVWQLPKDRPAIGGRPVQKDYAWWDPQEIGKEVLEKSTQVVLEPLPTDREWTTLFSFKHKADIGRFLYVKIDKGIKSHDEYVLAKAFDVVAQVPKMPRELKILHEGSILSASGSRKVSVLARDVEAVKFELGRVMPSEINHLVSQSGGSIASPYFYNYSFNFDNVSERFEETRVLEKLPRGKPQYTAFDFGEYMQTSDRRGLFQFRVMSWDPESDQPTGTEDHRFVLITDLGLVVKTAQNGQKDVFVVSIRSGEPVSGARVEVLGKNGLPIAAATTDSRGHVLFPPLSDFVREQEPTVFVARRGQDLSFMPYDERGSTVNYSRFDVGGIYTSSEQTNLSAYLFSDRGIYRPGDTFNVGMIVKRADWSGGLEGVPLQAVVTDARGMVVKRETIKLPREGFVETRYATSETSPTGDWDVSLYLIGEDGERRDLLGSVSVRVEEFLPDRMRITTTLSKLRAEGWIDPKDLKGLVNLQNLFGTPAQGRQVAGTLTLVPWHPAFRVYKDFRFFDPVRAESSFSESLGDVMTDENGEAEFPFDLEKFDDATYWLTFRAEGFEAEGGRSVAAQTSVLVSPNPYLIGYKPDGDLRYIKRGSQRSVRLIAVGPTLEQVDAQGLKARLVELRYVSVLTKQASGVYKYESVRKEVQVSEKPLGIAAKGFDFPLDTERPGSFALILENAKGTELSRIEYSVIGAANLTRSLEKDAELQLKLARTDYAPGDVIEMEIKAPYTGTGLITIERERVYAFKWFKTSTQSTVQQITLPNDLEGNGYVNVTFVRDLDSEEIFMSPLSVGVAPFSVSRERRHNAVDLVAPDLVRPGEELKVSYATKRRGKIVVFGVDEGILQVAGYKTPDPLGHFFRRRALEVRTAQILDQILPEFELVRRLSAPGGGGEDLLAANLNPFKRKRDAPVAFWSGIMESGPDTAEFTYTVPDYFNGTIRVMAVAVSEDALGVAETKTISRGHFVLSPNVPTFVAPDDQVRVSLAVANNVEGSGEQAEVRVRLATSPHLKVLEGAEQTVTIPEGREATVGFTLAATHELGGAELTFTASSGGKEARFKTTTSVRPPNPHRTEVKVGHFVKDRERVPIERQLYPQYRTRTASASVLPLGLARGLASYLEDFPHACTEQLVSKALPPILLKDRPEFGYDVVEVDQAFEQIISVLRSRQNSEGAFGFWAAGPHVSNFQSVYATHFLTEAAERGFPVPGDLQDAALSYLKELLKFLPDSLSEARTHAYAIYVLARNGVVASNELDTLLTQMRNKWPNAWEKDLAGVYVAGAQKLHLDDKAAQKQISEAEFSEKVVADYESFYDALVHNAGLLYILARHFPERLEDVSGENLAALVRPIELGHFNTISSAYAILALSAYADKVAEGPPTGLSIKEVLADDKLRPVTLPEGLFPMVDLSDEAKAVEFASTGGPTVFYQVVERGFDTGLPGSGYTEKLEVQREYRDADGNPVTEARIGDVITVHLKIRTIGDGPADNVAVIDLLPGGFEVELARGEERAANDGFVSPIALALSTLATNYVDLREDRVVVYGTAMPDAQEFVYKIRAVNQGEYQVPPVLAESMYDRTVRALSTSDRIKVGERQ